MLQQLVTIASCLPRLKKATDIAFNSPLEGDLPTPTTTEMAMLGQLPFSNIIASMHKIFAFLLLLRINLSNEVHIL